MAVYSFNNSYYFGEWKGFTVKWYEQLFHDAEVAIALKNSLLVAVSSAIISVGLAIPAALAGTRQTHNLASLLIYPPVIIPEITEAVALMLMLILLGFPLGVLSVLIGHTAFNVAYAYIAISPIAGRGKGLADAARTLGADPRTAFLKVVVPLAMPGILVALGLTFMMSFTDFIKTLFTKGPGFETLPILIWNRARRPGLNPYSSQSAIAALSTLLVVISLVIAIMYNLYLLKTEKNMEQSN
ncbi:MAG: ABC transporter permease [Desulfurococcales archaeon]|nr:ABC transporter permease [Desulfurococcales archaeon]